MKHTSIQVNHIQSDIELYELSNTARNFFEKNITKERLVEWCVCVFAKEQKKKYSIIVTNGKRRPFSDGGEDDDDGNK